MEQKERVQTKEEQTVEEATGMSENEIDQVEAIFEEVIDGRLEDSDYTIEAHNSEPFLVFRSRFSEKTVTLNLETSETEVSQEPKFSSEQLTTVRRQRVGGGD